MAAALHPTTHAEVPMFRLIDMQCIDVSQAARESTVLVTPAEAALYDCRSLHKLSADCDVAERSQLIQVVAQRNALAG